MSTPAEPVTPPAPPVTPPAPPATDPADLGDAGKKALTAERDARKAAETTAKTHEATIAERDAEIKRLQRSNAAQRGTDLDAIKEEMRGEFATQLAETSLRAEAKGRLANPADVLVFLKAADLSGRDEAAITKAVDELLKERPYLAAETDGKPKWGDVGGGNRGGTKDAEPTSALQRMSRAYSATK